MASSSIVAYQRRNPGRPREFDENTALDRAIVVFRERGYHAASIADLGAATGLTAGSLYKAFGDKRGIFRAAFARYTLNRAAALHTRLDRIPTGRGRIAETLRFYTESAQGVEGRRGCLVVGSAAALATLDADVASLVRKTVRRTETLLMTIIRQGQTDGSIGSSIDVASTARLILSLVQGLRIVGKVDGFGHADGVIPLVLKLLD